MGWQCPECGSRHEDISSDCSCGYSVYKILGIKPGVSGEEAMQAYKYLLTVWQAGRSSHDAISRKRSGERLKKINTAYGILREHLPGTPSGEEKGMPLKLLLLGGAGVIVLLGVLAFSVNLFKSEKIEGQGLTQNNQTAKLPAAEQGNAGQATGFPSAADQEQSSQPASPNLPETGSEMTEEMAVERVKKSHALLRNTSTESIVKKWTEDNSGKLQVIGWKARKMDDEKYLVSYAAMDGAVPKGFYFDLDIRTGEVVNLANRPDLQKRYNIQYSE